MTMIIALHRTTKPLLSIQSLSTYTSVFDITFGFVIFIYRSLGLGTGDSKPQAALVNFVKFFKAYNAFHSATCFEANVNCFVARVLRNSEFALNSIRCVERCHIYS